jgi:hypothetical protein
MEMSMSVSFFVERDMDKARSCLPMAVNMSENGRTIKWRVLGHVGIRMAMSIPDCIKEAVEAEKDVATLPMETCMSESGTKIRLRDMEYTITIMGTYTRDGLSMDADTEWASINITVEFWKCTIMKVMRGLDKDAGGVPTGKGHGEPAMVFCGNASLCMLHPTFPLSCANPEEQVDAGL